MSFNLYDSGLVCGAENVCGMEFNMIKLDQLKSNIEKVIVGKSEVIDMVMTSLICGGHILLEDVPGTGKTVLAKTLARSLDSDFSRVQFTPDLLPSDITGLNYYNQKEGEFVFKSGPIFCNILLADEINRATPRTQSALLECMEERQVTVDGQTRKLSAPFLVIATQNPVETTGTFPLPEAQLDRFFMKLSMGLPSHEEELGILSRFEHEQPLDELSAVCSSDDIIKAQSDYRNVYIHPILMDYIVDIAQKSRKHPHVVTGISPRGTLALLFAAKAYAYLHDRSYVVPEDIKATAVPVLSHRLVLNRGVGSQSTGAEIVSAILAEIKVPTESWERGGEGANS